MTAALFLRDGRAHSVLAVSLLVFAAGCNKSSTGPSETDTRTIGQFFANASAVGDTGRRDDASGRAAGRVQGAVVSTSLDSRTAVTDANGAFDLLTNAPNAVGVHCFRLMIDAPGFALQLRRLNREQQGDRCRAVYAESAAADGSEELQLRSARRVHRPAA
jgi:hypothetical protein